MTTLKHNPFVISPPEGAALERDWHTGAWPARWIAHPEAAHLPSVVAYRRAFAVAEDVTLRIHVSADERYALYLDGARIGRGPERGDRQHWFFETYTISLAAGEHCLVALVWALGEHAPLAQFSVQPGFILACDDPEWTSTLATGVASWETKRLDGLTFFKNNLGFGVGANVEIDGARFAWGFERGDGNGWLLPLIGVEGISAGSYDQYGTLSTAQHLAPATLPAMYAAPWRKGVVRHVAAAHDGDLVSIPIRRADDLPDEHAAWDGVLRGIASLTIAPHTRRRVLLDLEDYVCAYTHLVTSGGAGAAVRVSWAESLYDGALRAWWDIFHAQKGNRDAVEGKHYCGEGDIFRPDGSDHRVFENLWWKAGRYVEVLVATADEPLTIEALAFLETRYPLEPEVEFHASDSRFAQVWPIMVRALQMCSHETFMDCPYYEQLMYVGDTRLEALVTYCLTHDDRLPRKAITMFDVSRFPHGLTQARYPCRSTQLIPPFSLWWCGMVYDYALWRDDADFVRARMPGVRAVVDAFLSYRNADGLVAAPPGWNFVDWTTDLAWHRGTPPDGEGGVNGIINWHFALTLTYVAALEDWLGEPENAARMRRYAETVARATTAAFWDQKRGLFADDLAHAHFSEHAQCLALLSGLVDADKRARVAEGLLTADDLTRTTIYFNHYLFETYRLLGRVDRLFDRLEEWFVLPGLGFKTTREHPEPSRSDCHAWGAHPIYHSYATILGIRPSGLGFREVVIQPMLGPLTAVKATLPHPQGDIVVDLTQPEPGVLRGTLTLPPGVTGTLILGDEVFPLRGGLHDISTVCQRIERI
ncbi:MAG TPA: alpha-L-rhamnosidase C-terminal domain-containing protein [Anaerolineae bacterium]|nr:alpha-L-rhamnosidase C-terminal domain-containing protein [Anaerolineae bacterium]HQI87569.1 alpha-L-rhamnosidase C-terminal domain-containing protein [Anaerolineae bacterium]